MAHMCSQVIRYGTPWTYTSLTYSTHSVTYLYNPVENKFRLDNTNFTNTMTTKPKVLVTRGDHDPAAIARLGEFCDLEVCPEPRAMTRYHLYITSARDLVGGSRHARYLSALGF